MAHIVGFGNPLLDTIVFINGDFLLKKYNLAIDGQKEVSASEMKQLKNDIEKYDKTVTAGGCAQNTLKVMRWLLGEQCIPVIIGSVGGDSEAEILKEILRRNGVKTNYVKHEAYSTGATVSLVTGEYRSLVACLGAAEILSVDDIKDYMSIIDQANILYMEGFFLTERIDLATFILDYCDHKKKVFAFNLSGEYLCQLYPDTVKQFLDKSVIIFGNRREFQRLCSNMKIDNVLEFIKSLGQRGKTVVMTDGQNTVICSGNQGKIYEIDVPYLKKEEIIDTTGAGDSFVAGFLAGFFLKKDLEVCVKLGCYAAQEIIKQRGCFVPEYSPSFQDEKEA